MADLGRPPLPDDERKDVTFRIRVTATDRERIDAAAEKAGSTASEWAREILLRAAKSGGRGSRTRTSPNPSGST